MLSAIPFPDYPFFGLSHEFRPSTNSSDSLQMPSKRQGDDRLHSRSIFLPTSTTGILKILRTPQIEAYGRAETNPERRSVLLMLSLFGIFVRTPDYTAAARKARNRRRLIGQFQSHQQLQNHRRSPRRRTTCVSSQIVRLGAP